MSTILELLNRYVPWNESTEARYELATLKSAAQDERARIAAAIEAVPLEAIEAAFWKAPQDETRRAGLAAVRALLAAEVRRGEEPRRG